MCSMNESRNVMALHQQHKGMLQGCAAEVCAAGCVPVFTLHFDM